MSSRDVYRAKMLSQRKHVYNPVADEIRQLEYRLSILKRVRERDTRGKATFEGRLLSLLIFIRDADALPRSVRREIAQPILLYFREMQFNFGDNLWGTIPDAEFKVTKEKVVTEDSVWKEKGKFPSEISKEEISAIKAEGKRIRAEKEARSLSQLPQIVEKAFGDLPRIE